ncbi:unnamed protein product [Allacma fusca]|uniref:diacylglycerol O-acyltransferase n=1 Tax=Allacma fusca TaxID=39272 RepID=A0A8J2NXE1_9HEXA|nr:unnamed protein product [Allacma fusca]
MAKITLQSISNQALSIAFTILFLILYPTFIILFAPVYLCRLGVSMLKLICRPDLDKMIVTRSSILAIDNPYKSPKWNLCVWLTVDGDVNIDQFRDSFYKDIILRESQQGKLADPEFQQYYYKWLGFLFWKWEDNFDVKYHVRPYFEPETTKVTTLEEITEIIKKLTWSPFKEKTSPWEFLFVPKCEYDSREPKLVALFRFHHGLSDGFSILRLLLNKVCGVSMGTIAQPENFSKSRKRRIGDLLTFPFLAPYQFCKMLVHALDRNDWHKIKDRDLARPFNFAFSERIPTEFVKAVKSMHDVSFTAVVISAIAGGIRKAMIQEGLKVPKNISAGVPVPMPGHPTKMRNHL